MSSDRMFASKTLEARNSDDKPWAYSRGAKEGIGPFGHEERTAVRFDGAQLYFPRVEFQHGKLPANPILVSYRERIEDWTGATSAITRQFINDTATLVDDAEFGAFCRHAHRVLTLLITLRRESETP